MKKHVLSIDQGTTSSRAIIFDESFAIIAQAQQEFKQFFPQSGWVEHDPEEIWASTLATSRQAITSAGIDSSSIEAVGITNQRETTIVWDRASGKPVYPAIVWQDRRTSDYCSQLRHKGYEELVSSRTGLLIDPYFSATKIAWILEHVPGARKQAEQGKLAFGTVDSFLLYRLTDGRVHATDATNAARTMLFNIHENQWDAKLLELFSIPAAMLPEVMDCSADFGQTGADLFGVPLPVCGLVGDQQAALVGQACFEPGMLKSTYGTGCFAVLNTGTQPVRSANKLLTTIGYRLDGVTTYALEGSIFVAGAAVQWMRDAMGLIETAADSGLLASKADPNQDVYLVPAFTGLGAPYWDAEARGALFGITRGTGPAELSRAALESVCYQTRDLLEAMQSDWQRHALPVLRVDGGMVASDYTMQALADILNAPVERPNILETTAVGAAYLAGLRKGLYPPPDQFKTMWKPDRRFEPGMDDRLRERKYQGWKNAVRRSLSGF